MVNDTGRPVILDFGVARASDSDLFGARHVVDVGIQRRTGRVSAIVGVVGGRPPLGFPGVSGVTSFLPDGNARKRPYLLAISRGRIVGLD